MTRDGNNVDTSFEAMQMVSAEHMALGPLDGRYSNIGKKLSPYFSEYALVKNRVKVEVYWLIFLLENVSGSWILDSHYNDIEDIKNIYSNFSYDSFLRVKEIEKETNHDVKSVEIYVGEQLKEMGMNDLMSFVHIGCTSEDITNPSYANMISTALKELWIPTAEQLIELISSEFAKKYADTPMLAHTHGQPATPTTVGKEFAVYVHRMRESLENIKSIRPRAKFNGATGNYAAISVAFPDEDWPTLSKLFIEDYLGLKFNPVTTQIESHDYVCHILDGIRHFNNVLCDLDVDMWLYISKGYFKQVVVKAEVGSSTMPHKVNPIKFENSESNIDMSNAICVALSNKLPRSRMQRDLSDSSSQRNLGLAFGYSLQALEQTIGGLKRVTVNEEKISEELDNKWEVLAEPIQTMLRKYGVPDAYNKLKDFTRGKDISKEAIKEFIRTLDIEGFSEEDRETLLNLSPDKYTGYASQITEDAIFD